jgi:hypothetical protein
LRLDNLQRIEVYLAHGSEDWQVKGDGAVLVRALLLHHDMVEGIP